MAELLPDLRPCPFCNSPPLYQPMPDGRCHVICVSCGTVGPIGIDEAYAKKNWQGQSTNARPPSTANCPFCGWATATFQMVNDTEGGHMVCTVCGGVGPLGVDESRARVKWNEGDEASRPEVSPTDG